MLVFGQVGKIFCPNGPQIPIVCFDFANSSPNAPQAIKAMQIEKFSSDTVSIELIISLIVSWRGLESGELRICGYVRILRNHVMILNE